MRWSQKLHNSQQQQIQALLAYVEELTHQNEELRKIMESQNLERQRIVKNQNEEEQLRRLEGHNNEEESNS